MMNLLAIEKELNSIVSLPLPCHFCGKDITEKYAEKHGGNSETIIFHSLDGNHDNWDPSNKVPAHRGCHTSFHMKRVWKDPEYREKVPNKISKGMKRLCAKPEYQDRQSKSMKRAWKTRRELYGSSGCKDPEARGRGISKRMKDGGAKRLWEIRRERYGPTGIRQKESDIK